MPSRAGNVEIEFNGHFQHLNPRLTICAFQFTKHLNTVKAGLIIMSKQFYKN